MIDRETSTIFKQRARQRGGQLDRGKRGVFTMFRGGDRHRNRARAARPAPSPWHRPGSGEQRMIETARSTSRSTRRRQGGKFARADPPRLDNNSQLAQRGWGSRVRSL